MFLLDTNHLSVWQRGEGAEYERLFARLQKHTGEQIYVSIVSFHEMVNGWKAYMSKRRGSEPLVRAYFEFKKFCETSPLCNCYHSTVRQQKFLTN